MCADLKAWDKQPKRYWQNAPQDVQDFMLSAIDAYFRDKDQVQTNNTHELNDVTLYVRKH